MAGSNASDMMPERYRAPYFQPVAALEINRPPKPRAERRRWQREMERREKLNGWRPGEKNQIPKRRKRLFGRGNKDRYHR